MQDAVEVLVSLGQVPKVFAEPTEVKKYEEALGNIETPVSDEEASRLLACFGTDDGFGLAWTLVHIIETSSTPIPNSRPGPSANPWVQLLWERHSAARST